MADRGQLARYHIYYLNIPFHFSDDKCVHTSIVEIKQVITFLIEWYVVHTHTIEDNHIYIYTDQLKTLMP